MLLKGVKDEIEVRITAEVETDNGRTLKVPFRAKYKKPSVKESKETLEALERGDLTDESVIEQYLLGWSDLKGADDQDVPCTPDNVDAAMQAREYRVALVTGCMEVLVGREAIGRKNSSRSGTRSA